VTLDLLQVGEQAVEKKMSKYIYLAGGMEKSIDGKEWREKAQRVLEGLGHKIFNPYDEEPRIFGDQGPVYDLIYRYDKEKDYRKYNEVMSDIVRYDLGKIRDEITDILVRFDESVLLGAGTYAEISLAHLLDKPVHCYLYGIGIRRVPAWAIGCFTTIGYNLDEALDNLVKYDG